MPQRRLEEAYPLLDEESRRCDKALEMQFEKGDYDAYIRSSSNKIDAIMHVIRQLDSVQNDLASSYAGMLIGCDDDYRKEAVAEVLSKHGFRSEAAKLYLDMFRLSHKYEHLQSYRDNADDADSSSISDDLASEIFSRDQYDVKALRTLVLDGRGADAERYICKVGFAPRRIYGVYDLTGISAMCTLLCSRGFIEPAAVLGMGLIRMRLNIKDPDCHQDTVDMLRYMDGEAVSRTRPNSIPHSIGASRSSIPRCASSGACTRAPGWIKARSEAAAIGDRRHGIVFDSV